MSQTKYKIPTNRSGGYLTGILQRGTSDPAPKREEGRPIALLLHGVLAHKNQMYHKALCNRLVEDYDLDSFRFDFHGNDESPGDWLFSGFDEDVEDLKDVVEWLYREWGYRVHILIGHSRGSIVSCIWLSKIRPDPLPPFFVNISGRIVMSRSLARLPEYEPHFDKQGHYLWKARVAGKPVEVKMTREDLMAFAEHDTSFIETTFPQNVQVMTIHGTDDPTVPVEDAYIYDDILSKRGKGTHKLHIIDGATHIFENKSHQQEIVETISSWYSEKSRQPQTTEHSKL